MPSLLGLLYLEHGRLMLKRFFLKNTRWKTSSILIHTGVTSGTICHNPLQLEMGAGAGLSGGPVLAQLKGSKALRTHFKLHET